MVALRVYLFGGFGLQRGEDPLPAIPSREGRSLFAYLITYRDQPHTRDLLAGLFWPDVPDAQARRRLSQALWQIRRTLSSLPSPHPYVLTDADTLQFNVKAPYWLDVEEFSQRVNAVTSQPVDLLTSGLVASLTAAVRLYRGDFLAGYYDNWAAIERERLRDTYLMALDRLVGSCKAQGAFEEALAFARQIVRQDPLHEKAHREVMRLCHHLGRHNEALQQYGICRTVLVDELGVEPTPATTALYREIVASAGEVASPYLPPVAPRQPSPLLEAKGPVPLVGRQGERAALVSYVEHALGGRGGLVLVEGEAGVGKTRLLQEVEQDASWRTVQVLWGRGRELAEPPPYGVLCKPLEAGLSPLQAGQLAHMVDGIWLREASLILPQLAEWLPDLPPRVSLDPAQERERLREALTRVVLALGQITPHLLILDDLQWADEAALETLIHMTPRLPESRVLVIGSYRGEEARDRAVVWDALRTLDQAGGHERLLLAPLTAAETGELVRRALGLMRTAPLFEGRLFRETEGNPLFVLETLRALHDEGLLYRDEEGDWSTPWDETTVDYAELPLSPELHRLIAGRLARLEPAVRATLNTAAVLGADFDCALLVQTSTKEEASVLAAVDELLRRGLLVEKETAFHFSHDKVRQVAYMGMAETERRRRHRRAGSAVEALHPERIEALAHHFTQGGVWDKTLDYNRQAGDRARAVYAGAKAIGYYDRALEAWRHLRPPDQAVSLSLHQARGEICQETGRFDQAEADFQAAYTLAVQGDDLHAQARAMNCLSYLHFQRGDWNRAAEIAQRALSLSQTGGLPLQVARALLNKANALRNLGYHQQSVEVYKQSATLFEELNDHVHLADCLNRMGGAHLFGGNYTEAQRVMDRALAIRRQIDDKVGISYSLTNLTSLYHFQGKFASAKQAAQEAFDVASTIGDPYGQDIALANLGMLSLEQGSLSQAISLFERALAIARQIGDRPLEADALAELGRAHQCLDATEEARQVLKQALRIMPVSGECWHVPATHAYLAQVLLAAGESDQALARARAGLQAAQESEVPWTLGLAHRVMGEVAAHLGSERAAAEPNFHFAESVRILQAIGAEAELARSLAAYGLYLVRSADAGEARRGAALMKEAKTLFRRLGMAGDLARLETETAAQSQPHQISIRLPRSDAPTGRPLRDDEWVDVTWTVAAPKDDVIAGKVTRRQHRLLRVLREAADQGAAPTVDDLAAALGVSRATIKRDLAALRKAGHQVRTRGSRGVTDS